MSAPWNTPRLPRMRDGYGTSGFGIAVYLAAGLTVFVALLVVVILAGERHFGRVACDTFSRQTGRPTKFVIYTTFDGGDCLTRSGKGTWIPTRSLREFGNAPTP